jgi:hypothetical protein
MSLTEHVQQSFDNEILGAQREGTFDAGPSVAKGD